MNRIYSSIISLFFLIGCENWYNPEDYNNPLNCQKLFEIRNSSLGTKPDSILNIGVNTNEIYFIEYFANPIFKNDNYNLKITASSAGLLNNNKLDTTIVISNDSLTRLYFDSPQTESWWELTAKISTCEVSQLIVSNYNHLDTTFKISFDKGSIKGGGIETATLTANIWKGYEGEIGFNLSDGDFLGLEKHMDGYYSIKPINGVVTAKLKSINEAKDIVVTSWLTKEDSLKQTVKITVLNPEINSIFRFVDLVFANDTVNIFPNGLPSGGIKIFTHPNLRSEILTISSTILDPNLRVVKIDSQGGNIFDERFFYFNNPNKKGVYPVKFELNGFQRIIFLDANYKQLDSTFKVSIDKDSLKGGGIEIATLFAEIGEAYTGDIIFELSEGELLNKTKTGDNYSIKPVDGEASVSLKSLNEAKLIYIKSWLKDDENIKRYDTITVQEPILNSIFNFVDTTIIDDTINIISNGISHPGIKINTHPQLNEEKLIISSIIFDEEMKTEINKELSGNAFNIRVLNFTNPKNIGVFPVKFELNGFPRDMYFKGNFSPPDSTYLLFDKDTLASGDTLFFSLNFIKNTGQVTDDILISFKAFRLNLSGSPTVTTKSLLNGIETIKLNTSHQGRISKYDNSFVYNSSSFSGDAEISVEYQGLTINRYFYLKP